MKFLKQRWLWITVATFAILVLVVFIVRQPRAAVPDQSSAVTASHTTVDRPVQDSPAAKKSPDTSTVTTEEPDPSLPAPAKKLHKVVHDPEFRLEADASLDQRIKQLNKQVAEIDKQLGIRGTPAFQQPNDDNITRSTAERLQAIKAHLENQNTN